MPDAPAPPTTNQAVPEGRPIPSRTVSVEGRFALGMLGLDFWQAMPYPLRFCSSAFALSAIDSTLYPFSRAS